MKIKPKHIWRSGILTWDDADVLHISVVFTWHLPLARKYADSLRHRRVRIGGPAVKLAKEKRDAMKKPLELVDWSERYPKESPLQIAVRQSTVCLCGKVKEIGNEHCGCGKKVQ